MFDLSAFQRDLLFVIAGCDGEPVGMALKGDLERVREESITPGQLYPNLDTLVEAGLVEKESVNGRANAYRLTREGWQTLERYVDWAGGQLAAAAEPVGLVE